MRGWTSPCGHECGSFLYRGLKETASSLGLELEVVARPYAGVRGVWVPEGAEVPEIPRESGFKPLPKR